MATTGRSDAPRSCAVAAPHAAATEAAVDAVARGGSALDAALCAAVTLCVVYPHNTSLGGDLFALVQAPDGTVTAVNASGPAGRHVDAGAVRGRHGGRMPVRGIDTVTVPGAVAGLGGVHALGARLPWGAPFEAARSLAADGAAVAPGLARAIDEEADLLRADPGLRALFVPTDRPLRAGEAFRQPRLARTLERIAEGGPDELYRGDLALEIVSALRARGSALTEDDLAAFEPVVEGAVTRPFRGLDVSTAGPNSQGFVLLEILQALELAGYADPLGADAGLLSALFAAANRDRDRALADPAAMTETLAELLDPQRWAGIVAHASNPVPAAGATAAADAAPAAPRGDTIAVVAADSDGWAVSLIQSLFHSFGSGILDQRTGVVFHDRGALFSLDAASPNVLGPRKRPAHTLMPVLVHDAGRLRWAMGTMGGRAQPQIHAQVLLHLLDGADPDAAVCAPRWIVESAEAGDVALVEHGVAAAARHAIAGRMSCLDLPDRDDTTGHAQVVAVSAGQAGAAALSAGSDPRADGASAVVTMPGRPSQGQSRA